MPDLPHRLAATLIPPLADLAPEVDPGRGTDGLLPFVPVDETGIVAPLVVAGVALVIRGLVLAAEASVNGVGSARAAELGHSFAARSLAKVKSDEENTAATVRATLTLTLAVVVSAVASLAITLADRHGLGPVRTVLAAAFLAWLFVVATDPLARSIAADNPEPWALRTAPVLRVLRKFLSPVLRAIAWAGDLVLRPFGLRVRFTLPPPPLEEIERLLTEKPQEGAPEAALVRSLFGFSERTVKEIMVPRTDVVAIPHDATPEDVVRLIVEEGHTRMPVFRDTLDTIIGIVHVKDLLPLLAHPSLIILSDLLRPASFVPWNRPIPKVMRELQRKGQQFSVVVDEYGGVAGIVTLEDIVEQLVGEIRDEFDDAVPGLASSADGTVTVPADMRVTEFNHRFAADVPTDAGFETIGGFLASLAGNIPMEGDRYFFEGIEFHVSRREPRRVVEVRVTRLKPADAARTAHA